METRAFNLQVHPGHFLPDNSDWGKNAVKTTKAWVNKKISTPPPRNWTRMAPRVSRPYFIEVCFNIRRKKHRTSGAQAADCSEDSIEWRDNRKPPSENPRAAIIPARLTAAQLPGQEIDKPARQIKMQYYC